MNDLYSDRVPSNSLGGLSFWACSLWVVGMVEGQVPAQVNLVAGGSHWLGHFGNSGVDSAYQRRSEEG